MILGKSVRLVAAMTKFEMDLCTPKSGGQVSMETLVTGVQQLDQWSFEYVDYLL